MLSPLRNRFGIPGVISVIALVFAMLGGAYAANNPSDGGKATASAKAKRGPRGPKGPAGPAGPAGPVGPAGAAGAKGDTGAQGSKGDKGDKGEKGANGTNGTEGEDGKGVEGFAIAPGPTDTQCDEQGGAEYEVEDSGEPTAICNGKEGSPWTDKSLLPPGATETGTWAFSGTEADTDGILVPISFPIAYPFNLKEAHVHYSSEGTFGTFCEGTTFIPNPKPGELCVYENSLGGLVNATFDGIFKLDTSVESKGAIRPGAVLKFTPTAAVAHGVGTFAVEGCAKKAVPEEPAIPFECPAGS